MSVADTRRLISKSTENENSCNKTEIIMKIRINIQPPTSSIGALLQYNRTHWLHLCETSQHVVRQLALKTNCPSVVKCRNFKLSYNNMSYSLVACSLKRSCLAISINDTKLQVVHFCPKEEYLTPAVYVCPPLQFPKSS